MCNDHLFMCFYLRYLAACVLFFRLILTCGICFYSMYVLMVLFLTLIPVKHFVNLISVKGAILNKLIIDGAKLAASSC